MPPLCTYRLRIAWWATALLAVTSLAGACRNVPAAPEVGPSPQGDLVTLVKSYLEADDHEAERLLPALATRPLADLRTALRRVLASPPQASAPTGMLPDQPIRVGDEEFSYALYVPASYDPSRAYPLILCLHGAGFGGNAYLERWQPRLKEDYLLACPTIEDGAWWSRPAEALVLAVLAEISGRYHIDRERVFLTGMSNGGTGTYLIGLNHIDRFAALVPMASAFPHALFPLLDNAKHVPLYVIHGALDQVMPVRYSRDLAAHLTRQGYRIIYREHDKEHPVAGGHFFPREELPSLVEWLATQRREAAPRQIVVVRDRDHAGRAYWVRIDETTPAVASFWTSEHDPEQSRLLKGGAYARLEAAVDGNTVTVNARGIARYTLLFDEALVDWGRPVRVSTNGKTSFEDHVVPEARVLLREARRRPDPAQLVVAAIEILVAP